MKRSSLFLLSHYIYLKFEVCGRYLVDWICQIYLDPIILRADSLSYSSLLVPLSVCGIDAVVAADPRINKADHRITTVTVRILISSLCVLVRLFGIGFLKLVKEIKLFSQF